VTTRLLTLSLTFCVEEEDAPDRGELLAEIESRLLDLEGVTFASADIATQTRCYTLIAEVEGEVDWGDANDHMVETVVDFVKVVGEPRAGARVEEEI